MTLCPQCKTEMAVATTTSFEARNLELQADDQLECPECKARVWNWDKVCMLLRNAVRGEEVV